jgi:cytochrome b
MIVVLLTLTIAGSASGLFANDQILNTGPFYAAVSNGLSDRITRWHRYLAWISAAAIGIHMAAALYYLLIKKQDLMTPMLTGRKSDSHLPIESGIKSSRLGRAIAIAAALAGLFAFALWRAPVAGL